MPAAAGGCRWPLRVGGIDPIEVDPFATVRLLGLPAAGKKTRAGRRIHRAPQPRVSGLGHPLAPEHQLARSPAPRRLTRDTGAAPGGGLRTSPALGG